MSFHSDQKYGWRDTEQQSQRTRVVPSKERESTYLYPIIQKRSTGDENRSKLKFWSKILLYDLACIRVISFVLHQNNNSIKTTQKSCELANHSLVYGLGRA